MKFKSRHELLQNEGLTLASIGKRTMAMLVDFLIIGIIVFLFMKAIRLFGFDLKQVQIEGFTHINIKSTDIGSIGQFIIKAILVSVPTVYFTLTTYFLNGQTIGKKIFKIRVVSIYHNKVRFWHCIERSLGYVASTLEFGLGFIQVFWNPNKMALHDKIAETVVVDITFHNEAPKQEANS